MRFFGSGKRGFGRQDTVVGVCLHRALAVASVDANVADVHATELPTEAATQSKALAKLVTEHGLRGCEAAITLPPGSYGIFQIDRPPVEDNELVAAARWRVRSLLDYPVDEAVLQVFESPTPTERHNSPLVNVVAAPARVAREHAAVVKKAGLKPTRITLPEFALRNLVAKNADADNAVLAIFMTERQGIIQATHAHKIYISRRLDYGLSSIKPTGLLATGVHNSLPLEMRRTIDYFDSHYSVGRIRSIYAGPADPGLIEFMQAAGQMVDLEVKPLKLPAKFDVPPSKSSTFGLAEAYFALGGALSLHTTADELAVAV